MTKQMPWIRFFHSDFLNGVAGLNAQERGVYITLLSLMWEHGEPITANEAYLARQCGTTVPAFKKALQVLIDTRKIIQDESGLWNARAREEINQRSAKSAKAAASVSQRKDRQSDTSKNGTAKSSFLQSKKCSPPKPAENQGLGSTNVDKTFDEPPTIRDKDIDIPPTTSSEVVSPPPSSSKSAKAVVCPWTAGEPFPDQLVSIVNDAFAEVPMPVPWTAVENGLAEFIDYRTNRAPPSKRKLKNWPQAFANDLHLKIQNGRFDHVSTQSGPRNPQAQSRPAGSESAVRGIAKAFGAGSQSARSPGSAGSSPSFVDIDAG